MNLRRWLAIPVLVSLLWLLAACIVEQQPDRSILIYIPPPGASSSGVAPGTIPALAAATLMTRSAINPANDTPATRVITGTTTVTGTAAITGSATVTGTATITGTPTFVPTAPTAPLTGTMTTVPQTGTPTLIATAPTRVATGTGALTPTSTRQATPTNRTTPTLRPTSTAGATPSRTPTPTRTPAATATSRPTSTPATPLPTPTDIPDTVFLGRHHGFAEGGTYFVVGEVLNGDAYPVFNVKVIGSFYDSNNNLVAAQETSTLFAQIEPELSSPFKLQVSNNAGSIDRYELTLLWDDVSIVDYEELSIERAEVDEEANAIVGELRNEGSVSVQEIVVAVTLYSDEGEVVDVFVGSVNDPVLPAGESTSFTIPIPADREFERFEVQAQGSLKLF